MKCEWIFLKTMTVILARYIPTIVTYTSPRKKIQIFLFHLVHHWTCSKSSSYSVYFFRMAPSTRNMFICTTYDDVTFMVRALHRHVQVNAPCSAERARFLTRIGNLFTMTHSTTEDPSDFLPLLGRRKPASYFPNLRVTIQERHYSSV